MVSEIRTAAGRATQILNDLLDLTRSSFGTEIPVAKIKIDIASLCQEIADELRAINPDRRFEVTHEGDPVGSCDRARLGQVLSNLISNAIHYGDALSPITVTVVGSDPRTVAITVHNKGRPIRLEIQNVIFQSWMRSQEVKDPPEQSTHLGLGLYIAKLIVDAHGGAISVTSNEQAGATLSLWLPRS